MGFVPPNADAARRFDMGGVTNWCALTKFIEFEGSNILSHQPISGYASAMPLEFAVIFKGTAWCPLLH